MPLSLICALAIHSPDFWNVSGIKSEKRGVHPIPSHLLTCLNTDRLLDPSCSGSGIVNRLDHLLEAGA